MQTYLAQINIARMLAPLDSPVMADFVANLNRINELAENSKGFVWRFKEENDNATSVRVYNDDMILVNVSVWESVDDLHAYVYKSVHNELFKRKKEWFEKMKEQHTIMWYIPAGKMPTVADAIERLSYVRIHGDSPYAFGFKQRYTAEEALAFTPLNDKKG